MSRIAELPSRSGRAALVSCCLVMCLLPSRLSALDRSQRLTELNHTSWTAKDGLTGSALCLAQTDDGFLWIGTTDGLFRFDGVQFERFRPLERELPGLAVSALLAVPDGGLWVGYMRGRASFISHHGRVTTYSEQEGLPISRVRSFARTHDGAVWAAVIGGLARFDGTRWQKVRADWNYPPSSAWRVFVDRQGTLWVAAASPNGVYFLPKGARAFQDTGVRGGSLAIAQSADGTVFVLDDDETRVHAPPRGADAPRDTRSIPAITGYQFLFDRDGGVWIAGFDIARAELPESAPTSSQSRIPPIEKFTRKEGLSGSTAYDVFEDREGNIWVATEGGLDRFRNRNLTWQRLRTDAAAVSLVADRAGDLWALSPWEPYLMRVRDQKVVPDAPEALFAGFRDPGGTIWLAGARSFWQWDGGRFLKVDPPDIAVAKGIRFRVLATTWDRAGRMWVSIGGLGQFYRKDDRWTFVEVLPGRGDLTAVAAHTDASDRVWLAYRDEIGVIEAGQVRVFSKAEGLEIGALLTLGGREQQVLAGGEFGLALFHGGRFHTVRDTRGNSLGSVSGIVVLPSGVWLSTASGIVRIPEREFQQLSRDPQYRVNYEVFDLISDLPEPIPTRNSGEPGVVASAGVLWFVTTNGVARVDPQRIARNTLPPPVAIRAVVADDVAYTPHAPVALPALTRTLRIDYSGLSLSIPERVQFRYRLEGWESEWQEVGTRRTAFYTQLGPGSYRFRVIASNNDGVWNETGAMLAFTVAPAWYQTLAFKILVTLSGAGLLLLVYRMRLRQVASALGARFDERLAERTRIARELHDTFMQTVQVSKMTVDDALEAGTDPDRMRRVVQQLSEWLGQAVSEGRAALNSLRTSTVEVNDLAEAFRRAADSAARPEGLEVAVEVRGKSRDMHPIVRDEIYRIGYEAIRNAFAHSRASRLEIRLDYANDLTLVVADNGIGINPVLADKGKEGRFGLRGMRERAGAVAGTLAVSSSDAGTSITLVVPGRSAFRADPTADTVTVDR